MHDGTNSGTNGVTRGHTRWAAWAHYAWARGGRRRRTLVGLALGAWGGAGVLACGSSDSPLAPGTAQQDLATSFWGLTVAPWAVTLSTVAPYDTIRLVPTPRNAFGAPLTGSVLDSVATTYRLLDPTDTSVTITADGLVQARYAHDGSLVIVRTEVRGRTWADTIPVNVTDVVMPPQADTLMLSVTPDTLTVVIGFNPIGTVTTRVLDGAGQEIPHAAVRLRADPTRLRLPDLVRLVAGEDPNIVTAADHTSPGQPWLLAEATVYGVTVRDSVRVTITPPAVATLTAVFGTPKSVGHPVGHFEPAVDTLTIATDFVGDVGALVLFVNATATPIDVVFDDPASVSGSLLQGFVCGTVPSGNISAFRIDPANACAYDQLGYQLRVLTVPRTYHYHSALYGTQGTIVVLPR